MKAFFRSIGPSLRRFFYGFKVFFLYQYRLRPRILRMKRFVNRIVAIKHDIFPAGKSLFIFNGKDDNLYFIILKENTLISVSEVYDDVLNRIPERYQILPKIQFSDLFIQG